jgi:RNA recognition motif-containing protein
MKDKTRIKDIFVSDISYEVTEEDLHKLFSVCGTVRFIHLLTDPQGRFKGAAFVRMANDAENREAINMLDGTRLINRCISVVAARPKAELKPATVEIPEKRSRRRRTPKGRKK